MREREAREIHYGYIGRTGAYLSDVGLERMAHRQQRTLAAIRGACAVSPDGEQIDMQAIYAASIANPHNRRMELIVRTKGIADWAQREGYVGYAVAVTAPGRMHRCRTVGEGDTRRLIENDRWDGSTPRDTQRYLCKHWQHFRAQAKKHGYTVVGLRTVEPHKDGTPHWHLVLFVRPQHVRDALRRLRNNFLAVDGAERGARKRRVVCKRIKGGADAAVAYALAYISKNINGEGIELDLESGLPAADGAQRATLWARIWGIRQFQTFGAPRITVWRELRRVRDEALQVVREFMAHADPAIAQAAAGIAAGNLTPCATVATAAMRAGRADVLDTLTRLRDVHLAGLVSDPAATLGESWIAANEGQFRRFIYAQVAAPVGLLKTERQNAYGETIPAVVGVVSAAGHEVITREEGWSIRWGARAEKKGLGSAFAAQPRRGDAQRCPLGPVAITVTGVGNHYDNRQRGVEQFSREMCRDMALRRRPKTPIYSFYPSGEFR